MRIKTIMINGIRGFHYLDDSKDEPHIIKACGGNHLFIFGENGTGKSSLFDALELGITGDLSYEIKKRQTDESFIFNEYNKNTDSPYVKIEFDNSNKIERIFSNRKKNLKDDNNISHENLESIFIDTNRIEKFVIDRKDNLWKNFSELLGLDELLNFEIKLKKLMDKAESEYVKINNAINSLNEEKSELEEKINIMSSKFKENFGEDWENIISQINIKNYGDYFNLKIIKESFIKNYESQEEIKNKIKERKQRLIDISQSIQDTKIIELINEASRYFQSLEKLDKCPVCNSEIIFDQVKDGLMKMQQYFASYTILTSEIKNLELEIPKTLDNEFNELVKLINKFQLIDFEKNISLEDFYKLIKLKNVDIENAILQNTSSEIIDIKEYFNNKTSFESIKNQCASLKKEFEIKRKIKEETILLYNKYSEEYISKVNLELDYISEEEITKIYNKINQTENDDIEQIKIKADIKSKSLEFKIKLKDSPELYNANKILSTGHLRCLGFALLITRVLKKNLDLKTIVIDDPVYAIDHEHRYYLIKYLQELGKEYQLIILSSDRIFYDILTNTFDKDSYESYETCIGEIEGFCYKSSKIRENAGNFLSKAKEHLRQNDLRAASLYARLSFERQLFEVARNVSIDIPFKNKDNLSWRDLIDANIKAKIVEKYTSTNETLNNNEFDKILNHTYFSSLIHKFPLNVEAHYPHVKRPFYTKDEIKEVIETISQFNDYINKVMAG